MTNDLRQLATEFLDECKSRNVRVSTAESCTGGGIITLLTDIPGSSAVVDRGFVTYSNEAKVEMLKVLPATIERHGAVSEETALEMATGVLDHSRSQLALSVTGIAGPDGGSLEKPVGLVWFGVGLTGQAAIARKMVFDNKGRDHIRGQAVKTALQLGLDALRQTSS